MNCLKRIWKKPYLLFCKFTDLCSLMYWVKEGWCLCFCIDKEAPVLAQVCGQKHDHCTHGRKHLGAVDALPGQANGQRPLWHLCHEGCWTWHHAYGDLLRASYLSGKDKVTLCTQCTTDTTKPLRHSSITSPLETTSYIYCHVVDDHNNYCHNAGTKCGLSLETTWVTHRWANRVFAFIIGICEVNTYLTIKAFNHWDKSWSICFLFDGKYSR